MDFNQQFLHRDYFYAHSEPHRRRPTVSSFPRLIVHTATYYQSSSRPGHARGSVRQALLQILGGRPVADARSRFRDFLRVFEDKQTWQRVLGDPIKGHSKLAFDAEFLKRFCSPVPGAANSGHPARTNDSGEGDFEFAFEAECCHQNADSVVVRVERHAEYFCVTVFAPLDVAKGSLIDYYADAAQFFPQTYGGEAPRDHPIRALFWHIAKQFPQCTFANFRGVVAHAGCLPPAHNSAKPRFGAYHRAGASVQVDEARETEFYLRALKDHLRQSVFFSGDRDAVACYMQNGQVVYVSSIGSQFMRSPNDPPPPRAELRYLILYEEATGEHDLEDRHKALGGRDEDRERYRLSRLVHRLHTIGTLRLAALRDLAAIRQLNEELKQVELQLEPAASAPFERRDSRLMEVVRRLEDLAGSAMDGGVPIFYRTSRARNYFKQMELLVEDLNVGDIPDWQNYRQFMRRRLYSSIDFNSNFGRRVIELWELARSRAEFIESRTLLLLQDIAAVSAAIVVPLAIVDSLTNANPLWLWNDQVVKLPYAPTLTVAAVVFGSWLVLVSWRLYWRGRRRRLPPSAKDTSGES